MTLSVPFAETGGNYKAYSLDCYFFFYTNNAASYVFCYMAPGANIVDEEQKEPITQEVTKLFMDVRNNLDRENPDKPIKTPIGTVTVITDERIYIRPRVDSTGAVGDAEPGETFNVIGIDPSGWFKITFFQDQNVGYLPPDEVEFYGFPDV